MTINGTILPAEPESVQNGNLVPVWRYLLGIAGGLVLVLLSIVGTLALMGINDVNNQFRKEVASLSQLMIGINSKLDKLCESDAKIEKRLSALEILVTMSYEERMKALEKMRNFKHYGVHE